jgi:hypothetical protein
MILKISEQRVTTSDVGGNIISPLKNEIDQTASPSIINDNVDERFYIDQELIITDEVMEKLSLPNEMRRIYHGLIG